MRQILLLLLLNTCFFLENQAQSSNSRWQTGIFMSLDIPNIRVEGGLQSTVAMVNDFQVINNPGFSVGITGRYRIADPVYLRLGAGILFQNSELRFIWSDNEVHRESFELFSIFGPIVLEFQNDKLPLKPVFFVGLNYSYQHPSVDRGIVKLPIQSHEIAAHFGLAGHVRLPRFMLRPELSFNLGLSDWLRTPDELRYREAISSIRRDLITIRLMAISL